MVTLSVLMTGAYWSDVLLAGSDTAGQGVQMQENASTAEAAVYFTIYQCVAQFFVFNLFISVVLDAYNERVERQGMGVMLTEGQREWVKAQLHLLHDLPEKRSQAPSSRWRRRIHAVVTVRCRIQTQQESADAGTRRGIHAVERGRSGLGAA
jgi:hypothetical protein